MAKQQVPTSSWCKNYGRVLESCTGLQAVHPVNPRLYWNRRPDPLALSATKLARSGADGLGRGSFAKRANRAFYLDHFAVASCTGASEEGLET